MSKKRTPKPAKPEPQSEQLTGGGAYLPKEAVDRYGEETIKKLIERMTPKLKPRKREEESEHECGNHVEQNDLPE